MTISCIVSNIDVLAHTRHTLNGVIVWTNGTRGTPLNRVPVLTRHRRHQTLGFVSWTRSGGNGQTRGQTRSMARLQPPTPVQSTMTRPSRRTSTRSRPCSTRSLTTKPSRHHEANPKSSTTDNIADHSRCQNYVSMPEPIPGNPP